MAVERVDLGKYQPSCMLAHDFVNRLSVIVGYCDLLKDRMPEDSECRKRLGLIHHLAMNMANELQQHQCKLEVLVRVMEKKH